MKTLPTLRLLSILVLLLACENPFSTRTPEPPEQNTSTFIPPTSPDIVFINLRVAIQEENVENYIRCFVDSTRSNERFTFVPDQRAVTNNPGAFDFWQIEDERRYLNRVFQALPADSLRSARFIEENRSEGASQATFNQSYEIRVRHTRQNISTLYRGQSNFMLEKNQTGDWAIYRWEDFTNGVDLSWSDLKALFQ
ncbi:MAG TPA: hypothetical protein VGA99_00810 [bacterium]